MGGLQIAPDAVAALRQDAIERAPIEACGLLLGDGRWIERTVPARNLADSSEGYVLDPASFLRLEARDRTRIVGHYHSHPNGSAAPSTSDLAAARRCWPNGDSWLYVIVGEAPGIRAWALREGDFTELPIQVGDPH